MSLTCRMGESNLGITHLEVLEYGEPTGDWLRLHLDLGTSRTAALPFLRSHKSLSQGVGHHPLYLLAFLADLCPP